MKQKVFYILVPAAVLLGAFVYLWIAGAQDAAQVEQKVVRFHVVGASDEEQDQQLKLKVRDGLFEQIRLLFAPCTAPEQALETARENAPLLKEQAEQILRREGCDATVTVEVGERFFPTKVYGGLSFPAGTYQAVSVRIGAAKGENFWCVLYPALCLSPAVAAEEAEHEMAAVVGEKQTAFLEKNAPSLRLKFALAEWWGYFVNFFKNF